METNAAQNIINGKGHACLMRVHKLTLQALWQLLLPRFHNYLNGVDTILRNEPPDVCKSIDGENIAQLV